MIGASGRGVIAGGEEAGKHSLNLPEEEIKSMAGRVLGAMREAGYAHLDPEQAFISGFVEGYRNFFLFRQEDVIP